MSGGSFTEEPIFQVGQKGDQVLFVATAEDTIVRLSLQPEKAESVAEALEESAQLAREVDG